MTATLAFPDDDPNGVRHGYEAEGHAATTAALELNGPIEPVPYVAATLPSPTNPKEPHMPSKQRQPVTQEFLEQSSERLCDAVDQIKSGQVVSGGKAFVRELLRQPGK